MWSTSNKIRSTTSSSGHVKGTYDYESRYRAIPLTVHDVQRLDLLHNFLQSESRGTQYLLAVTDETRRRSEIFCADAKTMLRSRSVSSAPSPIYSTNRLASFHGVSLNNVVDLHESRA